MKNKVLNRSLFLVALFSASFFHAFAADDSAARYADAKYSFLDVARVVSAAD